MCRLIFGLIVLLLLTFGASAQVRDTARTSSVKADSLTRLHAAVVKVPDSILQKKFVSYYATIKTGKGSDSTVFQKKFADRLFASAEMGLNKRGTFSVNEAHIHKNKDALFYALVGLLFLLGMVMYFFDDYFTGFLRSFTQPNYRLSQTRENYARGYFPSFLLNFLFVLTGGLILSLLSQNSFQRYNIWQLWAFFAGAISIVYIVKFLALKISGYLFNVGRAVHTYTHIVFMINKFIGILLLPLLLIVAFRDNPQTDPLVQNLCSAFWTGIVLLWIYRYFVSFILIKNNLKINAFHFFIYLCAVEIIPTLVSYKFLIEYVNKTRLI